MAGVEESPEALNARGNQRKAAGDLAGAIESYRAALAKAPRYASALFNLGLALGEAGDPPGAEACFRKVSELHPSDGEALLHLGLAMRARGRSAEAAEVLARAVLLLPGSADAHEACGLALLDAERGEDAVFHFSEAKRLGTRSAELCNNLGTALQLAGRAAEAVDAFEEALGLDHALLQAHLNLGDHLAQQRDWPGAARFFAEAMRHHPDFPPLTDRLLFAMQQVCDWSRFDELCQRRLAALDRPDIVTTPFSLLSIPSTSSQQRTCAAAMARRVEERAAAARPSPFPRVPRRPGRLRVGYLSADFYEHVTAYVLAEVLELHNRDAFEIFAYSCAPDDGSALRTRIAAGVEHFVDLRRMSDLEAAQRIHADGVDILLEVNGYTQSARSGITALRPAPVQVNYLGYPGTLAAPYVQYVIADRFVFSAEVEKGFTEVPAYLPGCYAPSDRRREIAPTPPREALGLPEEGFVFCCFNQSFKILPQAFAAWMRILHGAPGSVLWLLEANALATRNLREEARRAGVDPARLVIAPKVKPAEYLSRLGAADLFLDTWPYNAHTTAADALWAGVPVLTLAGETFASRVAGSMVTAAGVPELATRSIAEYEGLAIRLARSVDDYAWLRAKVGEAREDAALFDIPSYTRALESAFHRMHEISVSGATPRPR